VAEAPRIKLPSALRGKRVAILSHSHPSLSKGGAEIAAHTLFVGLRAIGVDAILISCCEESMLDRLSLAPHEHAIIYRGARYDHFYHLSTIDVRRQLLDVLRDEQIEILNVHHFLHTGVGMFDDVAEAGIASVFTVHEFLAICHNHGQMITRGSQLLCDGPSPAACNACYPEHPRQQFAVRAQTFLNAFAHVGAFVSPSHFLAGRMVANGVPAERMHMIENGITHRAPQPPVAPLAPDEKIWKFGFFGQINPFKGLDVMLSACAILAREPDIARRLRIAIHGNFIGQSEEFIARFTSAVEEYSFLTYLGPYDNAIVGRLMGACDYIMAPSTWWENSPVVIQEAFQARRPVICTGIGGMAEKVTDRTTGLHFARNDAADLAARIIEGADPVLYQHLQSNIPETVTPDGMARAYADLFATVVKKGRPVVTA